MVTLFTLPVCPRCDLVKTRMDALDVEYTINADEEKAQQYSDRFWPIMVDENGKEYEFPEIMEYLRVIRDGRPTISQIEIITKE